jgi:hypothetical protein
LDTDASGTVSVGMLQRQRSDDDDDDDQWRYSPDRALASLYGFHDSLHCTMWGYQLHDRPILDTLIQASETSSSDYQRLAAKQGNTGEKWYLNFCRQAPIVLVGFSYMP